MQNSGLRRLSATACTAPLGPKIHAALAPAPQLKTMPRMRSNCLTISEKQTNHAQQKFGSLQEFSLQGMILSLFA